MPSDFNKVIAAESFKLRRQKPTFVVLALVVVLVLVMFVVLEFAARRNWMGVPSGYFVAASVISWMVNVTIILAVIITSFLISQEFALGTVKSTWVRPVTRGNWFAAKVATATISVTELFVMAAVIVITLAALRLGFTDLMEKGYTIHTSGSLTGRLLLTTGLTLCAMWAVTFFVAMIAVAFRHPGGAIAAGLGVGVAMMVLSAIPQIRPMLLITYTTLPMEQMVAMSKGLPLPLEWGQLVWRTLLCSGLWMVLAFAAGQRIIRRKEIST